ncbi:MAG: phytanoyl-CoA dioxygenase family protein [Gammaproteobacteria bacterium]|nr:phytanoyl-CoA dioxygenase family protein [Gammaproteobacteria bacterium]
MNELPRYAAPTDGRLNDQMLDDFRASGVLILDDFVTPEECDRLRRHTLELIEAFDPSEVKHVFSAMEQTQLGDRYFEESGDKIRFFFESDAFDDNGNLRQSKENCLNKMGHAMHDLDPVFDAFSRTPKLAATVNSLDYREPVILQSMYIFKPPRIGGEVYCHQDSTFLYTEPESCVGFWFALEDATVDNGCMHFIPGGHRMGLKELHCRDASGKMGFKTLDDTPWPENATRPAEAPAGTMVMFDGRAPHLSGPNRSDKSRHAYTLHVIDKQSRYPAENWLQRSPDLPLRGFSG